jgi:hypothetical protein
VLFDDSARTAAFCAALRGSRLQKLSLSTVRLFDCVPEGLAVLEACTAHPTLTHLHLHSNDGRMAEPHPSFGDALSKLVESPSRLRTLSLAGCRLAEADAKRVFGALGRAGMSSLDMSGSSIGEECGRRDVLPAVAANRGLRTLLLSKHLPWLAEAVALVEARA